MLSLRESNGTYGACINQQLTHVLQCAVDTEGIALFGNDLTVHMGFRIRDYISNPKN